MRTNIKKLIFIIFLSVNFLNLFAVTFKIVLVKIVPDDFYRKKIAALFNPFIGNLKSAIFREKIRQYLQERLDKSFVIVSFKDKRSDEFMELFGSEIKYLYPNGPSIFVTNIVSNKRFIEFKQAYSSCLEEIVAIREQIIYQRYYDDALKSFEKRFELIKCTRYQFMLEVQSTSVLSNTFMTPIEFALIKESNIFSAFVLKNLCIY